MAGQTVPQPFGAKPFVVPKGFDVRADAYMTAWARARRFSGSVLMAVDGKPIFRKAYGYADWSTHQPMTPETPLLLFSLTETVTAGAIVLLQQRNLLHTADKASQYLLNLPTAWGDVTVHQLLSHTSGIEPISGDAWMLAQGDAAEEAKATSAVAPRSTNPAEPYAHCSVDYFLLGKIIDKVSGKPYERFLHDELFKPLGMTGAGVGSHIESQPLVARGHTLNGSKLVPFDQGVESLGAEGDLHGSVDDLLKWTQAMETPGLFTPESLELIHSGYVQMSKTRLYCYGWQRDPARGFWEQSGGGNSFLADISRIPRQKLVVIMLRNIAPTISRLPSEDLIRMVEGGTVSPPRFADFDSLNGYAGAYQNGKEQPTVVAATNGELTVTLPGGKPEVAQFTGDGNFKTNDFTLGFSPAPSGNYLMKLHLAGTAKVLRRVEALQTTAAARPERIGSKMRRPAYSVKSRGTSQ